MQITDENTTTSAQQDNDKSRSYYRGLNIQGIWNHNIGNFSGPLYYAPTPFLAFIQGTAGDLLKNELQRASRGTLRVLCRSLKT